MHVKNHLFCGPLISSTAMEAYHMDAYHGSADMSGQARICANGRWCTIRTRLCLLVGDGVCRHAQTFGGLWLVTHLHRSLGEPHKPAAPDDPPQTTRVRCILWLTVSRRSLVGGDWCWQSAYAGSLCGFLPDIHAASCCHARDSHHREHMPFNRQQTLAETQVQMQYLQYAEPMPPSTKAHASGTPCQHILVSTPTIRNKWSQ